LRRNSKQHDITSRLSDHFSARDRNDPCPRIRKKLGGGSC
jgi:hypothetical protein